MGDIHQHGGKWFAPPSISADRQGTQGVAVITLFARNEVLSLRLANFYKVLACHL